MLASKVSMNSQKLVDWDSFHDEFSRVFGFPAFYGRNMDAWIDCMTVLDAPDDGMTMIHCAPGEILTLEMLDADDFIRCKEQYEALVRCAAFVNKRRLDVGEPAVLELTFTFHQNKD